MKSVTKKCKLCSREFSTRDRKRSKYCSKECGRFMSDDVKKKISESRTKYLLENRDKHPWRNNSKTKSAPCELVKQHLRDKGISFVEEWVPLDNRNFSIDIAFPDIKLGIEINGNQHYERNGQLKPYYQERHDIITSSGWTLLEYHFSIAYNIGALFDSLAAREQPDYSDYIKANLEKKFEKESKKRKGKPRGVTQKEKTDEKWSPFKELVLNSDIDFTCLGWCQKVSEILNIKPQKVGSWMKRHLPGFYENCYKRKSCCS